MGTSIKKNFFYQIFYQILISILPFITSPYISRVLGADKIGIYSYVFSIITFFNLFANLGINNYGNRLIAKSRDDAEELSKSFSSLLFLHVILNVVMLSIYLLFVNLMKPENSIIYIIQAIFLIANMIDISWLFFGLEKFKITVTRNSIIKIITVICVILFVKSKGDLWKYTLIMALGTFISQVSLWGFVKRYTKIKKVTLSEIILHIKPMFVLFGAAVAVTIFSYIDKIMLGKMSDMAQLGYYENAYKLIEFPVGFITALGTVMLPKISNLLTKKDKEAVKEYIKKSMQLSMIMASAIFFGIAAISKEFSYLFWGPDFIQSGIIIQYLAICIVLMSWNGVIRTQYLIPNERDKTYLLAVSVSAIVNVIINYILIPKYGAIGAAIGTICSYFVIWTIQNLSILKELPILNYAKKSIVYFIMGLLMYMIIAMINQRTMYSITTLILKIITGSSVYGILLIVYSYIVKDNFVIENIEKVKNKILRSRNKSNNI